MTAHLSLQHIAALLGHTHDEQEVALLYYTTVRPSRYEASRERSSTTKGEAGATGVAEAMHPNLGRGLAASGEPSMARQEKEDVVGR